MDHIFFELVANIWMNNTNAKRFCKSIDIIRLVLSNLHHESAVAALFAIHKMRGGPMRALLHDNLSDILAAFVAHTDTEVKRKLFSVIHYTRVTTKVFMYDEIIATYAVAWLKEDVEDRDIAVHLLYTLKMPCIRRVFDDAMARTLCDIFNQDWNAPASQLLQTVCKESPRALSRIAPHIGDSLYRAFLEHRESVEHLHPLLLHLRNVVHYSYDDRLIDYILNAPWDREVKLTATTLLTHTLTKTSEAPRALVGHSRFLELQHHLRHKITSPPTVGTHRSSQLLLHMLQCNITMHTRTLDAMRSYVAASPQTFTTYAHLNSSQADGLEAIVRVGKLLKVSAKVLAPFMAEMDRIQQQERVTQRLNRVGIAMKDVDTPNAFLCPVTLDVMKDPTVASDGHSYERSTLARLHKLKQKSPMTRERLDRGVAVPNVNLKKRIRDYLDDVCVVVEKKMRDT